MSGNSATMNCTFLDGSSHYCVVCCSSDPSVPAGSVGYLSSTSGPSVSVSLQSLGSNQMYYCKAAATNSNSASCGDPVVGGVKVFFSFMTSPLATAILIPPTSGTVHMLAVHMLAVHMLAVHTLAVHMLAVHLLAVHMLAVHMLAVHLLAVHMLAVHMLAVHMLAVHMLAVHMLAVHMLALHMLTVHMLTVHMLAVHC